MSQDNLPKDPANTDPFDMDFDDAFFKELDEIQSVEETGANSGTSFDSSTANNIDFSTNTDDNHANAHPDGSINVAPADTPAPTAPDTKDGLDDLSFLDSTGGTETQGFNINNLQDNDADARLSEALNSVQVAQKEEAVIAPIPTKPKKSLFGGFNKKDPKNDKKDNQPAKAEKPIKTPRSKSGDPKKLNLLILVAVLGLVALVAVWFLMQGNNEPQPTVAPSVAPAEPAPAPTAESESTEPVVADGTNPETEEMATEAVPTTNGVDTTTLSTAPTEAIDTEAIVNAEIPSDDALIKEEIDRLKDKETRLSEQAKLIDEQLSEMESLTQAKEEQIALLEKQIALLEEQKK